MTETTGEERLAQLEQAVIDAAAAEGEVEIETIAPISTSSSPEELEEAMNVSRIAAEAEKEILESGEDPLAEASDVDEDDEDAPLPDDDEEESFDDQEQTDETEEPEPEPEPERFSRRDAARFRSERDQYQQAWRATQAQLQAVRASDSSIIQAIAAQAGSESEFQQLVNKVVSGTATPAEHERTIVMQRWRQVSGPIYREAQQQVFNQWAGAYQAATQFEGMTPEAQQRIMSAADPLQALETIDANGYARGARDKTRELQAENQRLKAENQSLKTRNMANGRQPVSPGGLGGTATRKLPPMFLEDGITLNPDYERLASSGALLGVDLSAG